MSRQEQLSNLQNYLKEVDKDITMILQNLQWDRSTLTLGQFPLSKCKYNENHKVSNSKLREHEDMCFLKQNGYSSEEFFLPELLDTDGPTVVKFNSNAIKEIIDNAAKKDPMFKRGCNSEDVQPLTAERLQTTYTADERRAIHDAVVSSVRTQSEHVDEFVLLSGGSRAAGGDKSWLERLAEKRDLRRRRAKYRAPPKTRNYSLVLRDVISAQMELLSEVSGHSEADQSHPQNEDGVHIKKEIDETSRYESTDYSNTNRDEKSAQKSRHHSEKYSHDSDTRYNKRTEDTETRKYYDKHNKDEYNEDTECRRYYDKYKQQHQAPRYYNKTEDKRSKGETNVEDASRNYYRHTEYTHSRERERSRQETSKDKNKYKEHRDDKRYKSKDECTKSDERKREYADEMYEGHTERERYNSSDRKRGKYDEIHGRDKERSYSKQKSDYKHKKDY